MRTSKEIINIIKKRRLELNISQRELAKLTNLDNSTISRYEKHERNFPINEAPNFAKALNLDLNYLIGIEDKQHSTTLSNEEEVLLKNYNNSNTKGKNIIIDTSFTIVNTYPKIPPREEMIEYLKEFKTAAYGGGKNYYQMNDEELFSLYKELKEAFEDE